MNELLAMLSEWIDVAPRAARAWPDDTQWWIDGPSLSLTPLIWAARLAGVVLLVYVGRSAWRRAWAAAQPYVAFHRLARRLGLAVGDEWRLWRASRLAGLRSPVTLVVCAETMEHYAAAIRGHADERGDAGRRHAETVAGGLIRLRHQLFD